MLHEIESDQKLRVTSGGWKPDEPDPRPQISDVIAFEVLGQLQLEEAEVDRRLFSRFVPIGADDLDDIVGLEATELTFESQPPVGTGKEPGDFFLALGLIEAHDST